MTKIFNSQIPRPNPQVVLKHGLLNFGNWNLIIGDF